MGWSTGICLASVSLDTVAFFKATDDPMDETGAEDTDTVLRHLGICHSLHTTNESTGTSRRRVEKLLRIILADVLGLIRRNSQRSNHYEHKCGLIAS